VDFTFTNALTLLGPNAAFSLINAARPAANYLWAQFLPEMPSTSYQVKSGSMTVRTTMAGLVGMDSPYPPGGLVDVSTFLENSAKLAISVRLPEEALRTLQEMVMRAQIAGGNSPQMLAQEVLNFTNALLVQPQLDATEWLRGQAICTGAIDWKFNGKTLTVDYGVPAGNKLTARTGNDAYGGSTSKFWTDIRAARKLLRYNVRAFVAHPDMIDAIIGNTVNSLTVTSQTPTQVTVQRYITVNSLNVPSPDARDAVTLLSYALEGEIMDLANPGKTTNVKFMPNTKLVALGENTGSRYMVGAGGRPPVNYVLGYTHMAPTVESGGQPGRWARVFTPEREPWALVGESASNELPVVESPDKIVIMTSDLP
jgi:hypothetical protein